jgi:hypothetical protein
LAVSVVGRGVAVVREGVIKVAGSSEALAWAYSSLRWARERDRKNLAALLEEVVIELTFEEARNGSSPHHR